MDAVKKEQRFVGKTCILGLGYGMGHVKFRDTLKLGQMDIDEVEAKRIVSLYRNTYPSIVRLWDTAGSTLKSMCAGQSGVIGGVLPFSPEGIKLPNGLFIRYNRLQIAQDGFEYISDARTYRKLVACRVANTPTDELAWTKIYGGKVVENIIQALARIVITEQMAEIGQRHKVVFQVHDEIIVSAGTEEAQAVNKIWSV